MINVIEMNFGKAGRHEWMRKGDNYLFEATLKDVAQGRISSKLIWTKFIGRVTK